MTNALRLPVLTDYILNRKPERGAQWSNVLSAILDSPSAPQPIVQSIARLSFEAVDTSANNIEATDFLSGILFGINQRRPQAFRLAAFEHSSGMEDEDKVKFDKLIADIAMVRTIVLMK